MRNIGSASCMRQQNGGEVYTRRLARNPDPGSVPISPSSSVRARVVRGLLSSSRPSLNATTDAAIPDVFCRLRQGALHKLAQVLVTISNA